MVQEYFLLIANSALETARGSGASCAGLERVLHVPLSSPPSNPELILFQIL